MAAFEFHSRISYDEIDRDRNLSLRGVMGLLQEAAIIHSDLSGYSIRNVEQTHVIWVLLQWRIRLEDKVGWNEPITIRTWPKSMGKVTSERDFEILSADGRKIASATSNWALVSTDTGRLTRITPQMLDAYDLTHRDAFTDDFPKPDSEAGTEAFSCRVMRRDIDTNAHVNNRVYLDYAMEALPDAVANNVFSEVSIRYHKQLLLGQRVRCYYRCSYEYHVVDICGEDEKDLHATVILRE